MKPYSATLTIANRRRSSVHATVEHVDTVILRDIRELLTMYARIKGLDDTSFTVEFTTCEDCVITHINGEVIQ